MEINKVWNCKNKLSCVFVYFIDRQKYSESEAEIDPVVFMYALLTDEYSDRS